MEKSTLAQRVLQFLRAHRGESFIAREIAEAVVAAYPDIYADKAQRSGFTTHKQLIQQVVAEIGTNKEILLKQEPALVLQDLPRPRRYCILAQGGAATCDTAAHAAAEAVAAPADAAQQLPAEPSEHDLYPLLGEYLHGELGLYAMRIREGSSHNSYGRGGNRWLHPDLVALEPINRSWHQHVRDSAQLNGSTGVRMWSFEVKKELTMGNVRECFFQAVSNSSWAHEGYLVTTAIDSARTGQELRLLSALHGIGVMVLDRDDPSESDIFLPARSRSDADWQSINRLAGENGDFAQYMERVFVYLKTGSLQAWSRT